ncbi:MAG: response regulator [Aggregatilineales bacterium]
MSARILYIEDNPLNMRLVSKILRNMGYEMLEAMDGLTGLKMVETEKPDIVLVDVNLPDIDGLEVAARVKEHSELQHIPMIAITANAMYGDRERCLEAGCDDYVAKPVSRMELKNVIERFLSEKLSIGV